jgi:hypothetical protein
MTLLLDPSGIAIPTDGGRLTVSIKLQPAVQGDVGDRRIVRLDGVANLDGVDTIRAHAWRRNVADVELGVTVVDSAARTVEVDLGGADGWLATVTEAAVWFIEVEATFVDGSVLTWPADAPMTIAVRLQGDQ